MKHPGFPVALVLLVLFSAEASRRKDRAVHYMQYEGPDVGNVSATLERMEQSLMNAGSDLASGTEDSGSDENSGSKAEKNIGSKVDEGSGSQGARTIDMWACGKIRVSGAGFKKSNGDYPIKGFNQGFTVFCKNNNCRDSKIIWWRGWGWGIQTNTHGMHHRYNMKPKGKKTTIMNALPSGWQLRDGCTYSSRSRHCGKNPLPKLTCLAKVKTTTCPGGTDTIRYRGSAKGADIGGCGLTSCANRYRADRNTPEKCRDGCAKHGGCRSFSFAYPGASPGDGQKSVCTYYPKTTANQKYGEQQRLCKVKAVLKFKVKTMIEGMQRLVGATMIPKILAEHRAAQRLADRVYRGFATCSRIQRATTRGLGAMLRTRRSIGVSFKRCRKTQSARAIRAKTCTQVLVADNRAKAAACSAFRVVQKDPRKDWVVCKSKGGNYGAWVTQMKRVFAKKETQYKRYKVACDKASRKASARARRCAPFSRSSIRTKATCDARQDQLEQTTCTILTRTQSGCQKYMPCFARAKATSVRELRDVKRLANIRRAQFAEALRLRCLLGHGCKANAKQIKECAKRAHKETKSRLKLRFRRTPSIPRRCPAPVQPTCSSRYVSSFYSGLPRMAPAKRCKSCVGLSSALSLPANFKVRCKHDPAWSYVLDYSDVRSKDDLPSNRNLIARGFSNSNAFYIGNKRLQKLNIVKAEICALSSRTRTKAGSCQWSCKRLANSYWGNGRCPTCGGLNTNVKKIIAGLSGQVTSGNILININPEIARFQEGLRNIPWNCHRHRNLYRYGVGWHKAGWGISMRADHRAGNYEVGWYNNHCRYRGRLDVDTFQIRVQLKPQKIRMKKKGATFNQRLTWTFQETGCPTTTRYTGTWWLRQSKGTVLNDMMAYCTLTLSGKANSKQKKFCCGRSSCKPLACVKQTDFMKTAPTMIKFRRKPYFWLKAANYDGRRNTWRNAGTANVVLKRVRRTGSLATKSAAGHGSSKRITYIQGTTGTGLTFGKLVPWTDFTICALTRYTGGRKGRILLGGGNWLFGHWSGRAGVAHTQRWVTSYPDRRGTNWVALCGRAGRDGRTDNIVLDGHPIGNRRKLYRPSYGLVGVNFNPGRSCCSNERSNFAIAEILVWKGDALREGVAYFKKILGKKR